MSIVPVPTPDSSLLFGPFKAKAADVVLACTVPGDPCSKARARWNRKTETPYTPEKTRQREAGIALIAKVAHRELVMDPVALFSLRCGFYLGTNQARDVDNMVKLVADALKGLVWEDDRQVAEIFAFKTPAGQPSAARTEIAVIRMPGSMPYTFEHCLLCRRPFRTYPSWKYRAWCSRQCFGLASRRRQRMPCAQCGTSMLVREYRLRDHTQHFCSQGCKLDAGRQELTCEVCGIVFKQARWRVRRKGAICSKSCGVKKSWARRRALRDAERA